jgi:hypothetical protein
MFTWPEVLSRDKDSAKRSRALLLYQEATGSMIFPISFLMLRRAVGQNLTYTFFDYWLRANVARVHFTCGGLLKQKEEIYT